MQSACCNWLSGTGLGFTSQLLLDEKFCRCFLARPKHQQFFGNFAELINGVDVIDHPVVPLNFKELAWCHLMHGWGALHFCLLLLASVLAREKRKANGCYALRGKLPKRLLLPINPVPAPLLGWLLLLAGIKAHNQHSPLLSI